MPAWLALQHCQPVQLHSSQGLPCQHRVAARSGYSPGQVIWPAVRPQDERSQHKNKDRALKVLQVGSLTL